MSTVAILLSTYNGERFIDKQLQSIANQATSCDIELYIRDDGSTDKTRSIIEKWKDSINIRYIQGTNCGPARSFWQLLTNREIKADYFAFCDQDDIWDEDKIEKAIKCLNNNVHLYTCNCRSIDVNDNVIEEYRKKTAPQIAVENLFVSGFTQGCSMVFTSSLRDYICDMNISIVPMHDLIVCMYALAFGQVYWDYEPHFSYRFHENNVVANKKHRGLTAKMGSIRRWIKDRDVSLTLVADELIKNTSPKTGNSNLFLHHMVMARKSLKSKVFLLNYDGIKQMDQASLDSFYFRVLFNMI